MQKEQQQHLDYNKSFASHEKSKYWSIKNLDKPNEIHKYSKENRIFNCELCKHELTISLYNIVKSNSWCYYCNKNSSNFCGNDKCEFCFNRSFASHEKSKYLLVENKINPRFVTKYSGNKAKFNCNICKHIFNARICDITKKNSWCPYCARSGCKLCENNDCEYCFERSFASHERSKYWSPKNETQPRQVFKNTNKKYIFSCNSCLHDFSATLAHIVTDESWCPYCSTSGCILCDKEDCKVAMVDHLRVVIKPNIGVK